MKVNKDVEIKEKSGRSIYGEYVTNILSNKANNYEFDCKDQKEVNCVYNSLYQYCKRKGVLEKVEFFRVRTKLYLKRKED